MRSWLPVLLGAAGLAWYAQRQRQARDRDLPTGIDPSGTVLQEGSAWTTTARVPPWLPDAQRVTVTLDPAAVGPVDLSDEPATDYTPRLARADYRDQHLNRVTRYWTEQGTPWTVPGAYPGAPATAPQSAPQPSTTGGPSFGMFDALQGNPARRRPPRRNGPRPVYRRY